MARKKYNRDGKVPRQYTYDRKWLMKEIDDVFSRLKKMQETKEELYLDLCTMIQPEHIVMGKKTLDSYLDIGRVEYKETIYLESLGEALNAAVESYGSIDGGKQDG